MNTRLPHATLKNPTIEAVLGDHFRFASKAQAEERLVAIATSFSIAKDQSTPGALKLWIRGYGMTAESRTAGYLGNFAELAVVRAAEDKWTIAATLLNIDKKLHPERRAVPQKFPNWGHPILRDIQKGRLHTTVESAQDELKRLHETFPEVTIPLAAKCYAMVYKKAGEGKSPVEKWVFEIEARGAEGFTITAKPNDHKPKVKAEPKTAQPTPKQEAQGKFTAQVLLAKGRKKPRKPTGE